MNGRLTKVALLTDSLTDQDRNVLKSLHQHRLFTTRQVQRLFFSDGENEQSNARLTRLRLAKLEGRGLTRRLARRIGGVRAGSSGQIWQLTALGSRLTMHLVGGDAARAREVFEPGEAFVRHMTSCSEAYVRLHEADGQGRCELLDYQAEPECWRSFTGPYGEPIWLKPDGFVRLGVGAFEEHAFIEVDLATHGRTAIGRKLGVYMSYGASGDGDASSRVLWLAPDRSRQAWLEKLVGELSPEIAAQHQVAKFDDVLPALLREHAITEEGEKQ